MKINEESAEVAHHNVLKSAGALLPKRDAIDMRNVGEVENGTATYGGRGYKADHLTGSPCGIIDSQQDVGGGPVLNSLPAPKDTDHDGMPDEWERENGLDPNNAADRNNAAADGYTNLEVYLNSIG